jgi:hypothetical protein
VKTWLVALGNDSAGPPAELIAVRHRKLMRPGWNPVRRNRNIGTKKQGRGRSNTLRIPWSWRETKVFWENIKTFDIVERTVPSRERSLPFVVEHTRAGYYHACTPDDIARICSEIPPGDVDAIDFVVLRQPKRKEEILAACWGRAAFLAEVGRFSGAAVILEAQPTGLVIPWTKSLSPDRHRELGRLREDGHVVEETRRHYLIHTTPEAVRATQLYRTLLHEIGHLLDYNRNAVVWVRRPTGEKEVFAHSYADSLRQVLLDRGVISIGGGGT